MKNEFPKVAIQKEVLVLSEEKQYVMIFIKSMRQSHINSLMKKL